QRVRAYRSGQYHEPRLRTCLGGPAMRRSTDRILVSHAGTLPRPDDLAELMAAGPGSVEAFDRRGPRAVAEVVKTQADIGIDILNDGEQGKRGGFSNYISERLSGITQREDDRTP